LLTAWPVRSRITSVFISARSCFPAEPNHRIVQPLGN
jgi:hypothetical protein